MIQNELLSVDNGTDKIVPVDAELLSKEYYTSYAKYVLEYRALPSVYDGLKPVQRRIIYIANQYPQKLMKTAKLAGAVMSVHPHADTSITGSIYDMAHPSNVFPMFTTQGNFGGYNLGGAAPRYTECYLSELARQNFCQFIDYAEYEVGEIGELEPVAIPCLVSYALFRGAEGIGVGLSTKVMPLNLLDVIDYYIDYIKNDGTTKCYAYPDVGYVLLEMSKKEIRQAVKETKGRIQVSSIVTQISSNTLLVESVYDRSIDAVINKLDKQYGWFKNDQVGFRDASTSTCKYVFEVYDNKLDILKVKDAIIDATRRSGSYTRIMEEDGNAVYSTLEYAVKQSLSCLNKAIDKKVSQETIKVQDQLNVYTALSKCKTSGVFKNITTMTSDQLIDLIIRTSQTTMEIAQEIIKKPISYLTRSHDKEIQDLQNKLKDLQSHDRKSYLLKLYKDFRRAVLPYYNEKKHSVAQGSVIKNPGILLDTQGNIEVVDGKGIPFTSKVYFVTENGSVYPRSIDSTMASQVVVETDSRIIGLVTDKSKYLKITTNVHTTGYVGISTYDLTTLTEDKQMLTLRDENNEEIIRVEGIDRLSKELNSTLKGTRRSKTTWIKK